MGIQTKLGFKEDVAIVKIKKTEQWHEDPTQDIHLRMGKGLPLRSMEAIKPEDIISSVEFEDFKNPMELDMKQEEFMDRVIDMIEG